MLLPANLIYAFNPAYLLVKSNHILMAAILPSEAQRQVICFRPIKGQIIVRGALGFSAKVVFFNKKPQISRSNLYHSYTD